MSDDAIRKALEVAASARCLACMPLLERDGGPCKRACSGCRNEAAAAIAAFLEDVHAAPGEHRVWTLRELSAAVRRAAGGG